MKGKTKTGLNFSSGIVEMVHGSGGRAMSQLVDELFISAFDNPYLSQKNDQASFDLPAGRVVMATDSHVVSPLFFPGGDIGSLAIHGTVNDICMSGAKPYFLSAGFILEEGYPLKSLKRIVDSMALAAGEAGVTIVTGDTKVVERGNGDGVFISTTGVGVIPTGLDIAGSNVKPGDKIILSGSIGDHGVAVMSQRENLTFETTLLSDSQSLNDLVDVMVTAVPEIKCMRDPTRGGLGTTLNEIAQQSGVGIQFDEMQIPISAQVASACEFLGLDPLYIANEGKLVAFCAPEHSDQLLAVMRAHPKGWEASIIGEAVVDDHRFVQMKTAFGGSRVVDWLSGEQLPRIC